MYASQRSESDSSRESPSFLTPCCIISFRRYSELSMNLEHAATASVYPSNDSFIVLSSSCFSMAMANLSQKLFETTISNNTEFAKIETLRASHVTIDNGDAIQHRSMKKILNDDAMDNGSFSHNDKQYHEPEQPRESIVLTQIHDGTYIAHQKTPSSNETISTNRKKSTSSTDRKQVTTTPVHTILHTIRQNWSNTKMSYTKISINLLTKDMS